MNKKTLQVTPPIAVNNPKVEWEHIDFVLLDLDGTLLDKYFDDSFWEELVPREYAASKKISEEEAKRIILAEYKAQDGNLRWVDLDYWTDRLELNIPQMKEAYADHVAVHEGVLPFLDFLKRADKKVAVFTNAHPKAVAIKFNRVSLRPYLHKIVTAMEVGTLKETLPFWEGAAKLFPFDKTRALFVDDSEDALVAASQFGIRHLLYKSYASSRIARGDSTRFTSIRNFSEITPSLDT